MTYALRDAASEEVSALACDKKPDRLDMARLYNEVLCRENVKLMID